MPIDQKILQQLWANDPGLEELNLGYHQLTQVDITSLSEALKVNKVLIKLGLEDCNLGAEEIRALGEALKVNKRLKTLNLSCNDPGAIGTQALVEALKMNGTLRVLNISASGLNAEAAQAFKEALKMNDTLRVLDISSNDFDVEGVRAFKEALKVNSTVKILNLDFNKLFQTMFRQGEEDTREALANEIHAIEALVARNLAQSKQEVEAMLARGLRAYSQKAYSLAKVYFTQVLEEELELEYGLKAWKEAEKEEFLTTTNKQFLFLHRGLSSLSLGLYAEAISDLQEVKFLGKDYESEAVAKALEEAELSFKQQAAAFEAFIAFSKEQEARLTQAGSASETGKEIAIPEDLCCPITGELMHDPVVTEDGECYEREAITRWLSTHNTSPRTNALLAHKNLVPNRATFRQIQTFLEKHPSLVASNAYYLPEAVKARAREAVLQQQIDTLRELLKTHRGLLFHAFENSYLLPFVVEHGNAASLALVLESLGSQLKAALAQQIEEPRALLLTLAIQGLEDAFQILIEALGYEVETLLHLVKDWQGQRDDVLACAVKALFTKLFLLGMNNRYSPWEVIVLLEFSREQLVSLLPYLPLAYIGRDFYRQMAVCCLKEGYLEGIKVALEASVREEGVGNIKSLLEEAAFLALASKDFELLSNFIQLGASIEAENAEGPLYRLLFETTPKKALPILAASRIRLSEALLDPWMKQAIEEGQLELAQALHAQGASLAYQDANRNTFLHLAAAKGHRTVALWLMAQGCSEKAENTQGLRPRAVALASGFAELANTLAEQHRRLKFQFFIAPLQAEIEALTERLAQVESKQNNNFTRANPPMQNLPQPNSSGQPLPAVGPSTPGNASQSNLPVVNPWQQFMPNPAAVGPSTPGNTSQSNLPVVNNPWQYLNATRDRKGKRIVK